MDELEDFNDFQNLFDEDDDELSTEQNIKGEPYRVEYNFKINNFFKETGPFQSPTFESAGHKYNITATKNKGSIPFLDIKITLENPEKSAHSVNICITVPNGDESRARTQVASFSEHYPKSIFSNFIGIQSLIEKEEGIVIECIIEYAPSDNSLFNSFYNNSREQTGYVGIINQGSTCYMNSMLQALFHLPAFRSIVYQMPTDGIEDTEKSIPINLQRLFYNLQFSPKAVSTKDLTKSFGWDSGDALVQHDIQEFLRVLISNLEDKLKGTDLENSISSILKGISINYVRCINVDFTSETRSDFYDLQLQVKNNESLANAFEQYIEQETLSGRNQYKTDEFGMQDANMGTGFIELPPVLHLHLNRIEYDYNTDRMEKINQYFTYPAEIDMQPYVENQNEPLPYELYGVLVHSGIATGGHYIAFIKPTPEQDWLLFNDAIVRKAKETEVFEGNFGEKNEKEEEEEEKHERPARQVKGKNSRYQRVFSKKGKGKTNKQVARKPKKKKNTAIRTAYMLVYIRKDRISELYNPVGTFPSHLHEYFAKLEEEAEARRQEKLTKTNNAQVQIITEKLIALPSTVGFTVEEANRLYITVQLNDPLSNIYNSISDIIGQSKDSFSVWLCGAYGNPVKFIAPDSELSTRSIISRTSVLFVINQAVFESGTYNLFIKEFNYPNISYIGCKQFKATSLPSDIIATLNIESADVYLEEFGAKARLIENSLSVSRVQNGSIIVIQRKNQPIVEKDMTLDPIPIYNLIDKYPSNEFSNFMLYKHHSSIASVTNPENDKHVNILMPTSCTLQEAKEAISKAFEFNYNTEVNSLVLFDKCPIKTIDRAFRQPIAMKFYPDISEEKMSHLIHQKICISLDGFKVDKTITKLFNKSITINEVYQKLTEEGLVNEPIDKYRFFTVWANEVWDVLSPISKLIDETVDLRVDYVQHVSNKILNCSHVCAENEEDQFPPFLLQIIEDESFIDTKKRINQIDEEESNKLLFEFCSVKGGKEKHIVLNDDAVLSKMEINKESSLRIIHSSSSVMKRVKKDAPLKIFN